MTLSDIRLLIRQNLAQGNLNASFFLDSDINTFINDGIKEACTKGKVLLTHTGLTVQSTVTTYLLPWQVIIIKSLTRDDGTPIPMVDVNNKGMYYVPFTTVPSAYYLSQVAITYTEWQANNPYGVWGTSPSLVSYITPTIGNDYFYECTTTGTSGATQPNFSTTLGATTVDNNITWVTRENTGGLYQLTLNVTPVAPPTGILYDMWYQAMDSPLASDEQSPTFPFALHRCLTSWGTYKCAEMMKQSKMAVAYLTEFTNVLGLTAPTGA